MNLSDLRKNPHLSASSINTYIDCGLMYRFGKIDRLPIEFQSDAMEFGTAIHRVLADHNNVRQGGYRYKLINLHALFTTYWAEAAKDNDRIKYSKGKSYEILLEEGKALLTTFLKEHPDEGFKVLAIEEAFSFMVDGIPIPLIGSMDLVEEDPSGTIIITDYKTSSRAYSNNDVDINDQLTIYNMAAKANGFADREILLRFQVLIKTKTPKFEQYYTVRSEEDEHMMARKIRNVWEGISKEVFIPNTGHWKCKGCSYKSYCEDYLTKEAA